MLDTSACIDFHDGKPATVRWFEQQDRSAIVLSAIVATELEVGVYMLGNRRQERERLNAFFRRYKVLPFTGQAAREAGNIIAALAIKNSPTGYRDALIAGHAKVLGLTVVTANPQDFTKAPGVKVFALN